MNHPQFIQMSSEEYEHITRALIVYDHLRGRNAERESKRPVEPPELQDRWMHEAERFGVLLSPESRDTLFDAAHQEVDAFLEGETWHELAWWIAERECKRLGGKFDDAEAEELVTDQMYHQVMEEFMAHGIENVSVRGIPGNAIAPKRVAEALKNLRKQTQNIS